MALEDIFRALEEQADRDIEAVLAEAKQHAAVIHEDAVKEAQLAKETRVAAAKAAASQRNMQALNSVKLEMRKQVASAKERAVANVFTDAKAALGSVRARPDYAMLFESMLREALDGTSGEVEVIVDPADAGLARQVLDKIGREATVSTDIASAGGVVVALDKRRIMRRNMLEDRLDKFEGVSQADVAEILFA